MNQQELIEAVARGIDPNIMLNNQTPLLCEVVASGDVELTAWLIDAGAEVNARSTAGVTPLMIAVALASSSQGIKLLKLLLSSGADPRATDCLGQDCLHYCSNENPNRQQILLLLRQKQNPDIHL